MKLLNNNKEKDKSKNNNKQQPSTNKLAKARTKRKRSRSSPLSVLLSEGLEKITDGNIVAQESPFEISYNKIFASHHVKQVIQIIELPSDGLETGYIEQFEKIIKSKLPISETETVELISVQYVLPNKQSMGSKKLQSVEQRVTKVLQGELERYEVMKNPMLGVNNDIKELAQKDRRLASSIQAKTSTRDELHIQELQIKRLRKKLESFKVVDRYQREGGVCVDVFNFIEVVGTNVELTAMAVKQLKEVLITGGFSFREITDLEGYQKSFSLTSINPPNKKSSFDCIPFITTSNIILATTENAGITRMRRPDIFIGNNVDNNYRVDLNLSGSSFAENYLMIGKAGKTLSLMNSFLYWLKDNNKYLIVKEYKGKEWTAFAKLFNKHSIITMDADNTTFVNTLVIADYKKYGFSNPATSYTLSYSITSKLLLSLLNPINPTQTEEVICNKIVQQCYIINKVDIHSPVTYSNSLNIDFMSAIWNAIVTVTDNPENIDIYGISDLSKIKFSLARYFSPTGARNFLFKQPINLDTILFKNRVVLFDYNKNGTSDEGLSDSELYCRMLQQMFVERLFCSLRKKNGEHTIVLQEDLDEVIESPMLVEEISKSYNNPSSINIATLRSTATLFNNSNPYINKLLQTISGYIVGNCDKIVADDLMANTNLVAFPNTLHNLVRGEGVYKHSFLWYNTNNRFEPVVTKHTIPFDYLRVLQPYKA